MNRLSYFTCLGKWLICQAAMKQSNVDAFDLNGGHGTLCLSVLLEPTQQSVIWATNIHAAGQPAELTRRCTHADSVQRGQIKPLSILLRCS